MYVYWTGTTDSPTLKKLHRYRDNIGDHWFDLGVELLENSDVEALRIIKKEFPKDIRRCCSEMFQLWLERCPSAEWKDLISALHYIGCKHLAEKIQNEVYGMYVYKFQST